MPLDPKQYGIIIEAETRKCAIEIYLNDIPVGLCGVGGSRKLTLPVHEFLVDGENELAVLINPGDKPSAAQRPSEGPRPAEGAQPPSSPLLDSFLGEDEEEQSEAEKELFADQNEDDETDADGKKEPAEETAKEGPSAPSELNGLTDRDFRHKSEAAVDGGDDPGTPREGLSVDPEAVFVTRLSRYKVGAMAMDGTGEPIIQLAWRTRDEEGRLSRARAPFPRWIRAKKDLGPMFGPLHWQDAPRLRLDEATTDEAAGIVLKIRQALEDGDADPILAASRQRSEEVARVYAISERERADMLRQLLAIQRDKPEWLFETPEDDSYDFRLVADGRMIECLGPDWRPIVRQVPPSDDDRFLYPMLLGRAKGKWFIMR